MDFTERFYPMFTKMYVDEPDNWQPIEEAQVRQELASCYRNVDDVINCIRMGGKARTPWAFYRWTLTAAPSVPCASEPAGRPAGTYVDYFRRRLITNAEWRRLEIENLYK